ncbi:hypothetical protein OOZ63_04595 [Paucibacter sp. PLA-PC-4]|uniref:hypothetical protein n=1 Tax=Paucibacter sp. PLA-PC-4 TaxID=2993655 RepID=UPI002248ABD6|nr:hypothetical protein [Paucibacter sp. PLA-PC-4]MCX2861115.1 hypothetical protein [Paucibacter sp. PLA-PC-4]
MHLMIPHASALGEAGRHAAQTLALPRLAALLGRLTPDSSLGSDEYSLNTPLEQALAAQWGWADALPFAAAQAADDGIAVEAKAWALLTPLHLSVGSDQITALNPQALKLDEAESRAFFESLAWLFPADEGWTMAWGAASRWYVAHDSLADLHSASLERVINRNVDPWMPEARRLRSLQNELQMLLHRHALNEAREARGALTLNSVWISGCGRAQPRRPQPDLRVDTRLREPLINEDWAAWAEVWAQLDAGPLCELLKRAEAGQPVELTLCGERFARRYRPQARRGLSQLWHKLAAPKGDVLAALEAL